MSTYAWSIACVLASISGSLAARQHYTASEAACLALLRQYSVTSMLSAPGIVGHRRVAWLLRQACGITYECSSTILTVVREERDLMIAATNARAVEGTPKARRVA